MFKKVLGYAGEYRRTTYSAALVMLAGMVMNIAPFLFIYQPVSYTHLHPHIGALL